MPTSSDTKRTVTFVGQIEGLCKDAVYSLTVNQYSSVKAPYTCSQAGPLIGGKKGLIEKSLKTSKRLGLVSVSTADKPFSLIATYVDPVSILGGSCVMQLVTDPCKEKCKQRGKDCPRKICAPITQIPAT